MALPDLSRLPVLGTPPLANDTVAGVVAASQQNVRWAASNFVAGGGGGTDTFPVINVKLPPYNAAGTGLVDDRAKIQAAFDAAFGPWNGTPHGASNRTSNVPVYFPAGTYLTNGPLYLKEVYGGMIFGNGMESTTINFAPTVNGNAIIPNPTAVITGSISGTALIVSGITSMSVPQTLEPANVLSISGNVSIVAGTTITAQTVFTPNGTHGVANNTTTFVDATANAFTAAMVGQRITFTAGLPGVPFSAIITQVSSASTVVLSTVPGNASGVSWQLVGWTGTYTISPSNPTIGSGTINVAGAGSDITPCIMTQGMGWVTMSGMTLLGGVAGTSTNNTTGVYYYSNPNPTVQRDASTSTACRWTNMNITTFYIGMIAGYGINIGTNQENCILTNVIFSNCPRYGLRLFNQNTLNWLTLGGGATNCGTGSTSANISGAGSAAYSVQGAGLTMIDPSLSVNGWDIIINAAQAFFLTGGSSESMSILGITGAVAQISGFTARPPSSPGSVFVDCQFGGTVTISGCAYGPGDATGGGKIVELGSGGVAIIDNLYGGSNTVNTGFSGSGNSNLWYKNSFNNLFATIANLVANYTGNINEWSTQPFAVAALPTAAPKWKGVRMVVTDSNVTTFRGIATTGGSNTVPVFCDGSNWLVG